MRYLVLLCGDETAMTEPGTPGWEAEMAGYAAFDELAGEAVVGGEALLGNDTCRVIRHDGGTVRATAGPYAETVEGVGGFYVLDAPTLDDTIELVRHLPAVHDGAVEVRPLVEWFTADGPAAGAPRWFATIHGKETEADEPGTPAWDEGAAEHARFVAGAGPAVLGGGAVQPAGTASTVRVRDGELLVTDGPYAELAEVVGGFYLLAGPPATVDGVAAGIPVPEGGAVQLREVMELGG